jgi:hypothetical protein
MKVQPGWSWSKSIKPKAGTDSCELQHTGFLVGGRLTVKCDDGTQTTIEAGSAYVIEPGHDAWVEGDEPVEMIEFNSKSAQTMAKTLE